MDLADQIDDYICSFEGVGDLTMDTLAMVIFAWAVLALFLLWLAKFLYRKYVKKSDVTQVGASGETTTTATSKTISDLSSAAGAGTVGSGIGAAGDKLLRKSEPRDILSKENRGVTKSAPKSGGSAIPSTPTLRKRLSRKSPGPELRSKRPAVAPPSNVVGPDTVSVTWTSQVFRWLYTDLVIVNELLHSWVTSINESTKKTVDEHGVAVEIIRVLPESPPPTISNLFCNNSEQNPSDVNITWDCECMPVLQVKAYRQKSGKLETSHYKATVSRLRGRVSTKINYLTLKGSMNIEGYPDIRVTLNSIGPIKGDNQDETQLQALVIDILVNGLRSTTYPVDFSGYVTCPRGLAMDGADDSSSISDSQHLFNHHDGLGPNATVSSGKRLLVKVVKGAGLSQASDAYCVVEMDEPPQKNQTGARQGVNPYWDEHFLFDLSPSSAEILFEVYDRPSVAGDPPRFLGLGLVGVDELTVGPASSQILSLQPRPYETEKVYGAITVDFVFIEGAEVPTGRRPYKLKEALKISPTSTMGHHAGSNHGHTLNGMTDHHNVHGRDVADAAIRAIERGALHATANPSKSTLIIHSVQRDNEPIIKIALNEKGQIEVEEPNVSSPITDDVAVPSSPRADVDRDREDTDCDVATMSDKMLEDAILSPTDSLVVSETLESIEDSAGEMELQKSSGSDKAPGEPQARSSPRQLNYTNGHSQAATLPRTRLDGQLMSPSSGNDSSQLDDSDRGRQRKKRDFFGTIKRRLNRSKTRTKSADRGMIPFDAANPNLETRSISADRSLQNNNTSTGPRLIVPTLDQSRRSSLSESSAISGISSASTKTYTHEASTLVLETIENGVKRHFLVPLAIAQRPRWRRKGTKLHIYNDHTFVAKHLSGGLMCDVCNRSIPRRPGKQGYECRDCLTKCHKQCHVRAPQACPNATVLSIELSKLNSAAADRSIRKL